LTVILKSEPTVCPLGVPVLPVAVPGAADSPGTNNCRRAKLPGVTVTDGLVLAVLVASLTSVAVTVRLPAVFRVTLKVRVPLSRAAFAGKLALLSDEVMPTMSILAISFAIQTPPRASSAVCGPH